MQILYSALDWGLGHATRSIPVIKALQNLGYGIDLVATKEQVIVFSENLQNIKYIECQPHKIRYGSNIAFGFNSLLLIVEIFKGIRRDKKLVRFLSSTNNYEAIISDNRYGFYCTNIKSFIITHQLQPLLPQKIRLFQFLFNQLITKKLKPFKQILIPDIAQYGLSGRLSKLDGKRLNISYIGILSRFKEPNTDKLENSDLLIILSGPEPQRSVLENKIITDLKRNHPTLNYLMVRGKPNSYNVSEGTITNHLTTEELNKAILNSKYVISRAGYSSIMDLIKLKKQALIIPTPGQTEQEYLVKHLHNNKILPSLTEQEFTIEKALQLLKKTKFKPQDKYSLNLEKALKAIL